MTQDNLSCSLDYVQTVPGPQAHNQKSVEGKLRETLLKLADSEAKVHLFSTLKRSGLATNDVRSFIEKQVNHKKIKKFEDARVKKCAMHSKLMDALSLSKRLRQTKNSMKERVLKKYQCNRAKGRKIIKDLICKYHDHKSTLLAEANKKIEFYKAKNELKKTTKEAPAETLELLSGVKGFSDAQDCVLMPEPPLGPFICDKSIKLSENELLLLSRGPKFMVLEDLSAEEFEIDVEKMVAKKKYNDAFKDVEEDLSVHQPGIQTPDQPRNRTPDRNIQTNASCQSKAEFQVSGLDRNNSNIDKDFNVRWLEASSKMPFDELNKAIDLGNLPASRYKHNKEICLPNLQDAKLEAAHQTRRTELKRVFDRVSLSKPADIKPQNSNYTESNLTPNEIEGLKSLRKRIKNGELLVVDTDKSKRFAIVSK